MSKARLLGLLALALVSLGAQAPSSPRPNATPPPKPRAATPAFEGRVTGPDGTPVEGALVIVKATDRQSPPASVHTDADGRFRIAVTRAVPHRLRVEAHGLAPAVIEGVVPGKPREIALAKGSAIDGVVRDGTTNELVAGARVLAVANQDVIGLPWDPSAGRPQARSDAKGRFRIEGLAHGFYSVSASAVGHGQGARARVPSGAHLKLFLFPSAGIQGTVWDPDGRPLSGAIVSAEPERIREGPSALQVVSDARGRFEILGLGEGPHRLIARHRDFAPAIVPDVAVPPKETADQDVTLRRPTSVAGRVVDSDGRPVRASVVVSEIDDQPAESLRDVLRAESGADGAFRIERVPPARLTLVVTAQGFAVGRSDVDAGAAGREADAGEIVLARGLTV
jgi:Carboxypeptidase regulatory-like domain